MLLPEALRSNIGLPCRFFQVESRALVCGEERAVLANNEWRVWLMDCPLSPLNSPFFDIMDMFSER